MKNGTDIAQLWVTVFIDGVPSSRLFLRLPTARTGWISSHFSRHAKARTSSALVIWLIENVHQAAGGLEETKVGEVIRFV